MFGDFKRALQNNQGDVAAELVSSESVDRFEQFRVWALNAPADELATFTPLEQIETLRLRRVFRTSDLVGLNGQQVIAKLVEIDELSTPFVKEAVLAEPVFQDRKCFFQIFDKSGAVKEKLIFVQEGDDWKIDLAGIEYIQNSIYNDMIQSKGMKASEVVESVVSKWGADIDLNLLWKPLRQSEHPSGTASLN